MQIISKFKDYYDCMQKFASYEDKPFVRNVVNHIIPNTLNIEFDDFVVGFCGKLYRGRTERKYKKWPNNLEYIDSHIYSTEQYVGLYMLAQQDRETKRRLDAYFTPVVDDRFFLLYNCPMFIVTNSYDNKINVCAHSMNKPQTKKRDWIDPPNTFKVKTLDQMEFHKVFGPEQAYMEIESYMRGVLFKENKSVPDMTNEDKINLSGHHKDSFKS